MLRTRHRPGEQPLLEPVEVAALGQPVMSVLAEHLQQPVTQPIRRIHCGHERFVNQTGDDIDDIELAGPGLGDHGLGHLQGEVVREHRQPLERALLDLAQQVIAPCHD